MSEIKQKRDDIEKRLREHDAARKLIKAELLALRHVCQHADSESWTHHDYGGGSDNYWVCKDCGLQKCNGRVGNYV
jgi:hypothetical protein